MKRAIVGFDVDDEGDWVAYLDCGHRQHVRHRPPFFNRPWVVTPEGRASRLGQPLACVRCDRFEFPETAVPYKQTPTFTEETIPAGLLGDHATPRGVWGKIHIIEGGLHYRIDETDQAFELTPDLPGVVVPEVKHHIELLGPVRFYIAFYRTVS